MYKMEPYCLKCKKLLKTLIHKFRVLVMVEQWYHQKVLYVIVKNQDLLNIKQQKGLLSKLGVKTPLGKMPILGDILF